MNRRGFLRGLLSSGAAVVVAPVISIAPPTPSIYDILNERLKAAYALTLRAIERQCFESVSGYSDMPPQWHKLFGDDD